MTYVMSYFLSQGQFNYVEVLIQPLLEGMNKVQVHAKRGVEEMIETTPVFISDSCLPILVRQKALQANVSNCSVSTLYCLFPEIDRARP